MQVQHDHKAPLSLRLAVHCFPLNLSIPNSLELSILAVVLLSWSRPVYR